MYNCYLKHLLVQSLLNLSNLFGKTETNGGQPHSGYPAPGRELKPEHPDYKRSAAANYDDDDDHDNNK
jgi:hypothetical protein